MDVELVDISSTMYYVDRGTPYIFHSMPLGFRWAKAARSSDA